MRAPLQPNTAAGSKLRSPRPMTTLNNITPSRPPASTGRTPRIYADHGVPPAPAAPSSLITAVTPGPSLVPTRSATRPLTIALAAAATMQHTTSPIAILRTMVRIASCAADSGSSLYKVKSDCRGL